jgi:hypothetical protein
LNIESFNLLTYCCCDLNDSYLHTIHVIVVTFLFSIAASALGSMNNDRCTGSNLNPKRIENIFSHPRQPRSVRPRLCLSLDTDSE